MRDRGPPSARGPAPRGRAVPPPPVFPSRGAARVVWRAAASLAAIPAVLLALHGQVLGYPFIADDYAFLAASRAGDLANLFGAFDTVQNYFRPIGRELYFLSVSWFAGADPYRFHLVNLGILLATLGLVVALGARLAGMRAGVLAGGIYALVYPHRVQLGWVSCGQDLLATLFGVGAVLCYLAGRTRLAGLTFLVALFSKESVAPLPLVMVAWEAASLAGHDRADRWGKAWRRTGPLWLATALWAALLIAVRLWRHAWAPAPGGPIPLADVSVDLRNFWEGYRSGLLTYVYLDQPLADLRAAMRTSSVHWLGIGFAMLTAALAFLWPRATANAGALVERRVRTNGERSAVRLGLGWAVLGALPLGLVGHHFSAYYVSFSAIGFALLAGTLAVRWPLPLVIAVFAGAATMNGWANAVDTFKIAAGEEGRPGVSYVTDARLLAQARYLDSLQVCLRADTPERGSVIYVSHAPHYALVASCGNLAPRIWFADQDLDLAAIGTYRPRADARPKCFVRYDPACQGFVRLPESLMEAIATGEGALDRGDCQAAILALERALGLAVPLTHDIERIELHNSLGVAALRCEDLPRADRAWRAALALAPDHREALLNLAALDAAGGRFERAKRGTLRVLSRRPEDPLALLYLSRLEQSRGDTAAAWEVWARLRMLHPGYAESAGAPAARRTGP